MRHIILMVMGAALCAAPMARADEDTATLRAIGMGRALYLTNCAQCHGTDARGAAIAEPHHGDATNAPDLTAIESRYGKFDSVKVANSINGKAWGACTSTMPCWQHVSRYEQGLGPAYTYLQTWKLAKYLESVQQTPPVPPVPAPQAQEDKEALQAIGKGRGVYLTNCAQCHGADARGAALAEPRDGGATRAPDLTAIELRDGKFDPTRVTHHIAGEPWRECTSDMPCWEKVMGRWSSHTEAYAHQQIWTLVKYLQFVQQTPR